jgi:hypothetical protein
MNTRVRLPLVTVIWVVIGLVVAVNKDYGHHLDNGSRVATFILAVVLWPILAAGGSVGITF